MTDLISFALANPLSIVCMVACAISLADLVVQHIKWHR